MFLDRMARGLVKVKALSNACSVDETARSGFVILILIQILY